MTGVRRVLALLDDTAAAAAAIELSSLVARQVQRPLEVVYVETASALRAAALPLARVLAPGGEWTPLAPQDVERGYAAQAARLRALTERIALRESLHWSMRTVRGALAQAALELRAQCDLVLVGGHGVAAALAPTTRRVPRRIVRVAGDDSPAGAAARALAQQLAQAWSALVDPLPGGAGAAALPQARCDLLIVPRDRLDAAALAQLAQPTLLVGES
ncbi:MAG: hypothetical protein HYZ20_20105 [Burkholderiales bacterium]|nr:hypothetical protein [Burkholderiales bacterium]